MGSVRRNLSWLLLQRGIELLIRFFVGAWLVRYLGPADFGAYAYAVSFVALFLEASLLGLDQIVVRELTRTPNRTGDVLATSMGLRLAAAVVGCVLVSGLALAFENDRQTALAIVVLAGQFWFNPALILELWFQSRVQIRYVVWARTVAALAVGALQAALILAGQPLEVFLWLVVVQSLLLSAGIILAFAAFGPNRLHWAFSWSMGRAMLREAWPLMVSGISISVYMRIDQVMLKQMAGTGAVGVYGAAVKLSELCYALPMALAISVFPTIVALRANGQKREYYGKLQAICDVLVLYSYVVIIGVWLFAPFLVHFLFGRLYDASVPVLRVHVVALLFVALGVIYTRWLTAEDRTMLVMLSAIIGAVLNVALNLAFIPAFGPLGAAWATVASYAAATFALPAFLPEMRPVRGVLVSALAAPMRLRSLVRAIVGPLRRRAAN